jgi:hypothetical protein
MTKLIIILSPPRSFSSVICTAIAQHPELYGFPELRLFVGDTVADVIEFSSQRDPAEYVGPSGLLRTLAQIHNGIQTRETILKALNWLNARQNWTTKKLFDYLLEKISPQIGVEKTPATARIPEFRERAYQCFPDAYYLHLTRHPVSTRRSMLLSDDGEDIVTGKKKNRQKSDPIYRWHRIHQEIIDFTNRLPEDKTMRLKGEDLLAQPDKFLLDIARWLGIKTDREAIEAMKHPENSVYASLGPDIAPGGNNLSFLSNPYLRQETIQTQSLQDFWQQRRQEFFDEFGFELEEDREAIEQIDRLAATLGYE